MLGIHARRVSQCAAPSASLLIGIGRCLMSRTGNWEVCVDRHVSIWPINKRGDYAGVERHGLKVPDVIKFWSKALIGEGCWEWAGSFFPEGYGAFNSKPAHRWVAEKYLKWPPTGNGWSIDHICRNRACVRPSHLRRVTQADNVRNSARVEVTHCPRGHPYSGYNLIVRKNMRTCRICKNACQQVVNQRHAQKRK